MWVRLPAAIVLLSVTLFGEASAAGLRSMEDLFGRPQVLGADMLRMLDEPRSSSWAAKVAEFRRLSLADRPNAVQRHVNQAHAVPSHPYRPVSPSTMMSRGGDCKGYALAKMAMLRDLGFVLDDMRLVVVALPFQAQAHAVLLLRHGGHFLVFDNLAEGVLVDRYAHDDFTAVLGLFQWPRTAAALRQPGIRW